MSKISLYLEDFAAALPKPSSFFLSDVKESLDKMAFSWKVRQDFYRHMSVQINNNVNELKALELFHKRLMRKKKKSCADVIADMIRRMNDGSGLANAIQYWVPIDEALTLVGGGMSGSIADSFALIVDAKARVTKVRRTAKGALTTPVLYLGVIYGLLLSLGLFMIPQLQATGQLANAHGEAAIVVALGQDSTSPWAAAPLAALAAAVMWIIWALPNWTGSHRTKAEEYFPFNFYRDIQGFVWTLTFTSMLRSGMSDIRILEDQIKYASPWLKQRLMALSQGMRNGSSLPKALIDSQYGFPNPDIIDDIESMADFTDFPARISQRARDWADELDWSTSEKMKTIGFIFNLVMYAIIIFVALGITSLTTQLGSATQYQ